MRINKYLASCGVCSRREADEMVTGGRVTINGVRVTELGTQILDTDIVAVDGKKIALQQKKVYIIMNKPKTYITTCSDEKGRKTVMDLLPKDIGRVFPVGRLDYDTEGLLLLTNDGDFALHVTHPKNNIQKVYIASVDQAVTTGQVLELLNHADSVKKLDDTTLEIIIHSGKNRVVRKMLSSVGLDVKRLKRIAIGSLQLGNLKPGEIIRLNTPPILD